MRIEKVEIIKYKNFENIIIDFEKNKDFPDVFSVASKNGGGKSTLLQFIFILLHCFMDNSKKQYIKNLLDVFSDITEELEFVKFTISHNDKKYYLNYKMHPSKSDEYNFDIYLDIKDTKKRIREFEENFSEFQRVIKIQRELKNIDRISPVIERDFHYLRRFINSKQEDYLYHSARTENDLESYKKLVELIMNNNSISENTLDELNSIYNNLKNKLDKLENTLKNQNLIYITHLSNNNVILLETQMPKELLIELSNKIFLTAPSSQIFLFLSDEEKHNIFNEFSNEKSRYFESYHESVKKAKNILNGFFTYDFASTELILQSFKKASEEDLKAKRKTGKYGLKYDELTDELKGFLDGKEITENETGDRVVFKSKIDSKELSPEDLSHGELKKLGVYIWLKYIVENDSIVLMDEVDIALHPKWQYELINDLSKWSENTEFVLATHSPQILSSTYYKNIIKLDNSKVKRFKKPPLDRDINAIIVEVMESENFPKDLLELHKKYRKLIEKGKKDTQEAKKLREEILEYESENSSFFQEINFDLELI
jgi:predicted ATP-binding protein involved in virulence